MKQLAGQVAIVTGAGRGIGRAIALALATEGTRVNLCSRTQRELASVAPEIKQLGGQALVACPASAMRMMVRCCCRRRYGRHRKKFGITPLLPTSRASFSV